MYLLLHFHLFRHNTSLLFFAVYLPYWRNYEYVRACHPLHPSYTVSIVWAMWPSLQDSEIDIFHAILSKPRTRLWVMSAAAELRGLRVSARYIKTYPIETHLDFIHGLYNFKSMDCAPIALIAYFYGKYDFKIIIFF